MRGTDASPGVVASAGTRGLLPLVIPSLVGVLGIGAVLVATAHGGIATSYDSADYISIARHLRSGQGYVTYAGSLAADRPPLFPALLAAFAFIGIDPFAAARGINALCFGLIILVTGMWLRRRVSLPS